MDYYIHTIYDKQNEKDCFNYYNEFEYIQNFVKVFWKSDDALMEHEVLSSKVCLYLIDYYKFLF